MILVIFMAGFAPYAGATMPANDEMPVKAMSSMPSNCHEQMVDEKPDNTSPCKTDAACATTCIMHAFKLSVFILPAPEFANAVISPAPIRNLVSLTYGPDIRPPIA